jgi:ankyrin repeat protein
VKRLLKEGADANAENKKGLTILQLAVRNGHHDCLETLIKDGKAKPSNKGL